MLSDRRQQILCALIEEYVAHACPVGSRTIAENHHLGVSSATIRNELSALEEAGYITQPHTSAGRIPTDAGYRQFVDELLDERELAGSAIEESLAAQLRERADKLDELMHRTSEELARLTECLSIVGYLDDGQGSGKLAHQQRLGLSSLMRKPEFKNTSSLLPLMEILENDTVSFKTFDEAARSQDGFAVCIGRENGEEALMGISVVAGVYDLGASQGIVAIIGPTRMDYTRTISAVRAAQDILNER